MSVDVYRDKTIKEKIDRMAVYSSVLGLSLLWLWWKNELYLFEGYALIVVLAWSYFFV